MLPLWYIFDYRELVLCLKNSPCTCAAVSSRGTQMKLPVCFIRPVREELLGAGAPMESANCAACILKLSSCDPATPPEPSSRCGRALEHLRGCGVSMWEVKCNASCRSCCAGADKWRRGLGAVGILSSNPHWREKDARKRERRQKETSLT